MCFGLSHDYGRTPWLTHDLLCEFSFSLSQALYMFTDFLFFYIHLNKNLNGGCTVPVSVRFCPWSACGLTVSSIEKLVYWTNRKLCVVPTTLLTMVLSVSLKISSQIDHKLQSCLKSFKYLYLTLVIYVYYNNIYSLNLITLHIEIMNQRKGLWQNRKFWEEWENLDKWHVPISVYIPIFNCLLTENGIYRRSKYYDISLIVIRTKKKNG